MKSLETPRTRNDAGRRMLAPLAALLVGVPLAALSAMATEIPPPDAFQLQFPPCINGWVGTSSYRVCFHDPGASSTLYHSLPSSFNTAAASVWTYSIPLPGTAPGPANVLFIPCAIARVNAQPIEPCNAIGTKVAPAPGLPSVEYTFEAPKVGPLEPAAYLVEIKVDVLVGPWGIYNEDALLICGDPLCETLPAF